MRNKKKKEGKKERKTTTLAIHKVGSLIFKNLILYALCRQYYIFKKEKRITFFKIAVMFLK